VDKIEFQWLLGDKSQKDALKELLGCSGQLLKKYFSNRELERHIHLQDLSRLPIDFMNHMQINPRYVGAPTVIIKETKDLLAIHKPPGIHCHPHCYSDQDTVLNSLVEMKKWEALLVNTSHYDRGLLYRLDQETSGVVLLAKNEKTFLKIRQEFQTEMKGKYYWAIVDNGFNSPGTHTHYLRASGVKGCKQKIADSFDEHATPGTLSVMKVMESETQSLLLIKLNTGLRHQIRTQLAALGFPILGDELYGGRADKRLFLHALRYEWGDEVIEDVQAELFDSFFDLDRAFQMGHDMFRIIKSR